jgi:hypothetical protein
VNPPRIPKHQKRQTRHPRDSRIERLAAQSVLLTRNIPLRQLAQLRERIPSALRSPLSSPLLLGTLLMHQHGVLKPSSPPRSALVFGAFIVPFLRRGSVARRRGILGRAVRCNGEALDGAQETVHALRRRPHRGVYIPYLAPRSYTHAHAQSAEWKRRVELSRDTGLVAAVLSLPSSTPRRSVSLHTYGSKAWRGSWKPETSAGVLLLGFLCRAWCKIWGNSECERGVGLCVDAGQQTNLLAAALGILVIFSPAAYSRSSHGTVGKACVRVSAT